MYCDSLDYHNSICIAIQYCDFNAIPWSKRIVRHMSAAEGQERAMTKPVFINHGNKSAKNKLAPFLKRRWRTSYEGKILEFWCRYNRLEQKLYCDIAKTIRYDISSMRIPLYVTV